MDNDALYKAYIDYIFSRYEYAWLTYCMKAKWRLNAIGE
jgi:hypothetical protein